MTTSRLRVWTWVHLVYLGLPAFQPIFDPTADAGDWALVAFIVVAFLPMYAMSLLRPWQARWWLTVPATVLGVLAVHFNAGAAVLFVYAAACAGLTETRRTALRWFGFLTTLTLVFGVLSATPMPYRLWNVVPPVLFIWVIGLVQIAEAARARANTELRMENARIEHLATVSERERIARDLHDLLGHSLTAVVMRAQLVEQLVAVDPERARAEVREIERTARDALSEVRATVSGWRQASLEAELDAARGALASTGVDLHVRRDPDLALLGSTEHALALAVREAITNVARHADARTCQVGIHAVDGELRVVVADDGVGGGADGNGLSGMRERIAALGGRVHRTATEGTTVTIAVPLRVAT
ncbi:sensor histidine kinase [Umezawaea tangerina]|uniref:Two-component system sensor histidine kinase DesK n=1 Tax=Umezawaea tangerina TaxID=84725 RepID=A0A2T0SV88_9PSEU|nr:sensor histidine kinase [Umezawaea tangerina]PRY37334.1 two-component system sensor histidine kinase DesK [Umezawaea tangerina]